MYRNLRIRYKLLLGFGIIIFISTSLITMGLTYINRVGDLVNQIYEGPLVATTETMGIRQDLNAIGLEMRNALLEKDISKYESAINENKQSIQTRVSAIKSAYSHWDTTLISTLESGLTDLGVQRDKAVSLMQSKKWSDAQTLILGDYTTSYNTCTNSATALYDDASERAGTFNRNAIQQVNSSALKLCIVYVLAFAAAIIVSSLTTKAVVTPLKEMQDAATRISEGDLEQKVTYSSKDELGVLADSLRSTTSNLKVIVSDINLVLSEMSKGNMIFKTSKPECYVGEFEPVLQSLRMVRQKVGSVLSKINESSEQVSTGSVQVSSSAQALAQGATEQSSEIDQLAITINNIADQVKTNASAAQDASHMAGQSSQQIDQSNEQMQEMRKAMEEIAEKSNQISKIIKAIDDISFQTNILSLNAAVEAARAGAAGKGFAVVASEVKQLAEKSSEAAKDTTALIEGTVSAVERGARLSENTAQSLQAAVDNTKKVTSLIDKISEASNNQASSIDQVTKGISQISAVVQTNSATAEESAAASEELSSQSKILKSMISQFQFDDKSAVKESGMAAGSSVMEPPVHIDLSEPTPVVRRIPSKLETQAKVAPVQHRTTAATPSPPASHTASKPAVSSAAAVKSPAKKPPVTTTQTLPAPVTIDLGESEYPTPNFVTAPIDLGMEPPKSSSPAAKKTAASAAPAIPAPPVTDASGKRYAPISTVDFSKNDKY